jgi:hypothetical protein
MTRVPFFSMMRGEEEMRRRAAVWWTSHLTVTIPHVLYTAHTHTNTRVYTRQCWWIREGVRLSPTGLLPHPGTKNLFHQQRRTSELLLGTMLLLLYMKSCWCVYAYVCDRQESHENTYVGLVSPRYVRDDGRWACKAEAVAAAGGLVQKRAPRANLARIRVQGPFPSLSRQMGMWACAPSRATWCVTRAFFFLLCSHRIYNRKF